MKDINGIKTNSNRNTQMRTVQVVQKSTLITSVTITLFVAFIAGYVTQLFV